MIIVDAFNVIHAAANLKGAPLVFKRLSVLGLAELIATCPAPGAKGRSGGAVLVVDGTGGGLQARLQTASDGGFVPGVRIAFAGAGREADALIEEMLEARFRGGNPAMGGGRRPTAVNSNHGGVGSGGVLVVSSDKRVRTAAKGARAQHLPSDVFLGLLARSVGGGSGSRSRETEVDAAGAHNRNAPLDAESARWWMRFLEVDDDLTQPLDGGGVEAEGPDARPKRKPLSVPPPSASPSAPALRQDSGNAAPSDVRNDQDQETRWTDPLLLEAIRVWGDRIRPGDLEMGKWLTDEAPGGQR